MEKAIDIFQFTHFRKYLDEYQAARVLTDPEFTRAGACALLGLPKTRSYYSDIVKGKKLSSRMIPKFVEVLGLNKKEAKYFETMVNFDQAKTTTERDAFFARCFLAPCLSRTLSSLRYCNSVSLAPLRFTRRFC